MDTYQKILEAQLAEDYEPDCGDFYLAEIEAKANEYDKIQEREQRYFINYLEAYIELLNDEPMEIDKFQIDLLKEILEKYKKTTKK